jgi:hypothetical protein
LSLDQRLNDENVEMSIQSDVFPSFHFPLLSLLTKLWPDYMSRCNGPAFSPFLETRCPTDKDQGD